jgi:hypothetical protein
MIRNVLTSLPRALPRILLASALMLGVSSLAAAQTKPDTKSAGQSAQKPAAANPAGKPTGKPAAAKPAAKQQAAAASSTEPGKPALVATIGDWGVYVTSGGAKQCYALAQPKDRLPKELKRDPAYLFISSRPSEKVRNEVSIIMGFDVKPTEKTPAEATVGADKFALASQGSHLWVRDTAKTGAIVDSLRKGGKLIVKAPSLRGNVTTDSYSLTGIGGALDRVQKECP